MIDDEAALLAAIRAASADDVPRLVYADWLDEHDTDECRECRGSGCPGPTVADMPPIRERVGRDALIERHVDLPAFDYRLKRCKTCDGSGRVPNANAERAEFIRVQCELATMPEMYYQCIGPIFGEGDEADYPGGRCGACASTKLKRCHYHRLWVRERDLHGRCRDKGVPSDWGFTCDWHRGFVTELHGPAESWVAHGDAVRALHPVERVELTTFPAWDGLMPEYWLTGDPTGRRFGEVELVRERRPQDEAGAVSAMLRLRWPGVAFTLPDPATMPEVPDAPADGGGGPPLDYLTLTTQPGVTTNVNPDGGETLTFAGEPAPRASGGRGRTDRRFRPPEDRGWRRRFPRP